MVRVLSPPQSRSKAVVCVSTPRMYQRSGYFLVNVYIYELKQGSHLLLSEDRKKQPLLGMLIALLLGKCVVFLSAQLCPEVIETSNPQRDGYRAFK